MAGDDDGLRAHLVEDGLAEGDHAVDAAAAVRVDEGVAGVVEDVAEVDGVVLAEDHRRIASGVRRADVDDVDFVAVEVQAHPVVEGNGGAGRRWVRLLQVLGDDEVEDVRLGHHLGGVPVRDDGGAGRAERQVALGVVEVPVGVDGVVDAPAAKPGDGGAHLRHHLREHVVDDQHAVFADGRRDVAADAEQHVQPVAHLLGGDLRAVEAPLEAPEELFEVEDLFLGLPGHCEHGAEQRQRCCDVLHVLAPSFGLQASPAGRGCAWR